MIAENDFLIPAWPEALHDVDVAEVRFVLDFISPCQLRPVDFLEVGRALRLTGRQLSNEKDAAEEHLWRTLFQPAVSEDPVARRKFQKPSPAFVMTIPIKQEESFQEGDQLALRVLFIGTGIPLIHVFLRSLVALGNLGLNAGDGRFKVIEAYSLGSDRVEDLAWRQQQPFDSFVCTVKPLTWLFHNERIEKTVIMAYVTPTRLLTDGRPLRRPLFRSIFPFLLRRVTSMLYAHSNIEAVDDPGFLLALADEVEILDTRMRWHDWRPLPGRPHQVVGGFVGEMVLSGDAIEELYWVLAVASLFGVGKGATYGAGHITLRC